MQRARASERHKDEISRVMAGSRRIQRDSFLRDEVDGVITVGEWPRAIADADPIRHQERFESSPLPRRYR